MHTTLLKPPPEKSTALSGMWMVPPTAVTLSLDEQLLLRLNVLDSQWTSRRESCNKFGLIASIISKTLLGGGIWVAVANSTVSRAKSKGDTSRAWEERDQCVVCECISVRRTYQVSRIHCMPVVRNLLELVHCQNVGWVRR